MAAPTTGRDRVLSPREVEGMIAEGRTIVIFEEFVLRLDSWLDKHPGGRLAILHMVGKDATDEMSVYHSAATLQTMKAYRIGRKPMGPWPSMTPPIRGGTYRPHPTTITETESETEGRPAPVAVAVDAGNGSDSDAESVSTGCQCRDYTGLSLNVPETCIARTGSTIQRASTPDIEAGVNKRDKLGDPTGRSTALMCPVKYTDWAVQQGVDEDLRDYPSLDQEVQQDIIRKYRLLHQQIIDEGLYDCPYWQYGKEMMRYVLLFALFVTTLRRGWYTTSAVFLGLFWHQIMFTAHDAGHRAITGNFVVDTLLGMFIADFCCGLSIGWWKSSHNVHHLMTNQPDHDPDIQNVPLFATCPSFFRSVHSTYYDFSFVWDAAADFLVPYQRYTYYPVMGIARFNLYLLSWLHVLSAKSSSLGGTTAWWIRPAEIAFMAGYWLVFGYGLLWCTLPTWRARILFVVVSHVVTMPLHVQITLSHWGMSTAELGERESFAQRQLRTTMDVDCPAWLDWIHGGLQFQAAHHLFPRVPRHNLRRVQELAMRFSRDVGIPYSVMGFVDGNKKVVGRLGQVSEQLRILVSCQRYMAETGESGLH